MSFTDKPSKNEDEYFLRRDAEWRKEQRARLDAERERQDRSRSGLACPRCQANLVARSFHEVMIDVCPTCNGVWLDNGELEMLGSVSRAEYEKLIKSLSGA
jgi:hypothetical protein